MPRAGRRWREINLRAAVDLRIEVARQGQVEDEDRPLAALGDLREVCRGDDRLRGTGRADYQVGLGQGPVELIPQDRLALPAGGQFLRPELAAVDSHDLPRSLVAEVADRLFRHLARPDHQRLVVEGLEDLPSEISHGHAGNARRAGGRLSRRQSAGRP